MLRLLQLLLATFSTLILLANSTFAQIAPEQVVVIANKNNPESLSVAEHYIRARKIPPSHLYSLDLPLGETMSRKEYEERLMLPLRERLSQQKFGARIRVLATVYGVPLRVGAPQPTEEEKKSILEASERRRAAASALRHSSKLADAVANPDGDPPSPLPAGDSELVTAVNARMKAAAERIRELDAPAEQSKATQELADAITLFGGFAGLQKNLRPSNKGAGNPGADKIAQLGKEVEGAKKLLAALDRTPSVENRTRAYEITMRVFGAVGVIARANRALVASRYDKADASVDSELSLLWWDREMYNLSNRLPNPLYYRSGISESESEMPLPVLMVGRIDAPTAAHARRMIDDAITAERDGLNGKAYIDTRGIKYTSKNEFAVWDQNMRDFAWMLRRVTDYRVSLDDFPQLLKEAEDTAVYVGWYQLRNYNDVFSFKPGAIGYHVASEEAISIHSPEEKGWCKNMLERGIAATLGAVAEPYLDSFPKPRQFFALMLTGKYTLVEAYYLTTPYVSWRLVLFGDPLYNPWKDRFEVPLKETALTNAKDNALADFPRPPSKFPVKDPVAARKELKQMQASREKALQEFFARQKRQAQEQGLRPEPPKPSLP